MRFRFSSGIAIRWVWWADYAASTTDSRSCSCRSSSFREMASGSRRTGSCMWCLCVVCLCTGSWLRRFRRPWRSCRLFLWCTSPVLLFVCDGARVEKEKEMLIEDRANFVLIAATVIALPIGRRHQRNDAKYIFSHTDNLTTWSPGFAWFLTWLSPIWTIGGFDSCGDVPQIQEMLQSQLLTPS